jgi:hypothetical protein
MRFLMSARIPTEDGNKMVQDPNFLSKIEKYVKKVNAEATYFFEAGGNRIVTFIVDIQNAGQIPILVEPLFSGMGPPSQKRFPFLVSPLHLKTYDQLFYLWTLQFILLMP